MHILVTNDDGVDAPGLLALVQIAREFGQVTVLAPHRNWSASGHVKTLSRPLRAWDVTLGDGSAAITCDGAPSDCVAMALLGLLPDEVDLVLSGVNPNPNLGHDVTYSGTVTAAMEAVIAGVPGMAFSLETKGAQADYAATTAIVRRVLATALANSMTAKTLLNVNIPGGALEEIQGIRVTRQGQRVYRDRLDARTDPRGRPYYWIGGDEPTGVLEEGTDFGALADGYVSITPLTLDLTAHETAKNLSGWSW